MHHNAAAATRPQRPANLLCFTPKHLLIEYEIPNLLPNGAKHRKGP